QFEDAGAIYVPAITHYGAVRRPAHQVVSSASSVLFTLVRSFSGRRFSNVTVGLFRRWRRTDVTKRPGTLVIFCVDRHGDRLAYAGARHVPDGRATEIVDETRWYLLLSAVSPVTTLKK